MTRLMTSRFTRASLLLALVLVGLPACSSRHWSMRTARPLALKEVQGDDGSHRSYVLVSVPRGQPRVDETVTSVREAPFVGIRTRAINADLATSLGVPAWKGVFLEEVVPDSSADLAGLRKGDILRFIDRHEVATPEQVSELIEGELRPGQEVTIKVQRSRAGESAYEVIMSLHEMTLVVGSRDVEYVTAQSHGLETSPGVYAHTGLQLGEMPPSLARECYGREEPQVLVAGVLPGSPGYLAGLRAGDRIVAVDGQGVASLDVVRRAFLTRAAERDYDSPPGDGGGVFDGAYTDLPEGDPEVSVVGPLGVLTARVGLVEDVQDDLDFHFPILLSVESDTKRTRWSFLDFIFQFGANYHSTYVPSETRRAETVTDFSMLPFGMFEYSRSPEWTEWTFLWFITFTV